MPKEKKYYVNIDKLLKYDALDKYMFAYVYGMRRALPGNSIYKCLEMFSEDFMLDEDSYPLDSAWRTYYRIFEDYRVYRENMGKLDN